MYYYVILFIMDFKLKPKQNIIVNNIPDTNVEQPIRFGTIANATDIDSFLSEFINNKRNKLKTAIVTDIKLPKGKFRGINISLIREEETNQIKMIINSPIKKEELDISMYKDTDIKIMSDKLKIVFEWRLINNQLKEIKRQQHELQRQEKVKELLELWYVDTPIWLRKIIADFSIDDIHNKVNEYIKNQNLTKDDIVYDHRTNRFLFKKDGKQPKIWHRIELNEFGSISIRRTLIYANIWTTCITTWIKWTKYALCLDEQNCKHLDLVSDNWEWLTIDHRIPLSKGWSSKLENLQVMLAEKNFEKWSNIEES